MARRADLHSKAEYICADLSSRPKLFPCSPAADHTFPVVIPFACSRAGHRFVGTDSRESWRLKGTDDLEVVADEDVVRPVNADIVNLVFAVT
jgi:hypothetical protein